MFPHDLPPFILHFGSCCGLTLSFILCEHRNVTTVLASSGKLSLVAGFLPLRGAFFNETITKVVIQRGIFLDYRPGISATDDVHKQDGAYFCEGCAEQAETLGIPASIKVKTFKTREDYYNKHERTILDPE
jgi:hypothetical protein